MVTSSAESHRQRKRGDGLEVPCVYVYFGSSRMVEKLKGLLEVKSLQ